MQFRFKSRGVSTAEANHGSLRILHTSSVAMYTKSLMKVYMKEIFNSFSLVAGF